MIKEIEKNLQRGITLLQTISDNDYANCSVAPYNSSIGCHMRHVLDVFSCVFEGLETKTVYLNKRRRNEILEQKTELGLGYFASTIQKLQQVNEAELDQKILVYDDLGLNVAAANYTLGAILMQAHSHAIHHFASIGYIIYQLGIELPDADFGYNPTTPRLKV